MNTKATKKPSATARALSMFTLHAQASQEVVTADQLAALGVRDGFSDVATSEARGEGVFRVIPIDKIDGDPSQPRKYFDESSLIELANSIRAQGILQPPTVRAHPEIRGRFMVVMGERRVRAARLADMREVECRVVDDWSPTTILAAQLIENSEKARQNVRPLEEAISIGALVELMKSQKEAAKALGVSQSFVSKRLELLELPEEIQSLMKSNDLGDLETALALSSLQKYDRGAYTGFVREAMEGRAPKRQMVMAALKVAKNGGTRLVVTSEMSQKLTAQRSALIKALQSLGLGASVSGLEFCSKGKAKAVHVKLTLDFQSLAGVESFEKILKA